MIRAVIDTNVLFEGLSGRGPCGAVVDAWVARRFVPCVSTTLALEYEEILTNRFGEAKRPTVLKALQALLDRVEWVPVHHRIRPFSPDPDDDFIVECAFSAEAPIVTRNLRDLNLAEQALGIPVLTPEDFLLRLEV
ncbi:MAG: putative toxin-antitoxin system toxin component, PIN family [Pseudomonadota bacterium]